LSIIIQKDIVQQFQTGDYQMLETPQERVKLLKAGIDGKTIERLYIIFNNLKIVHALLLFELIEINAEETPMSNFIYT
jgi:hypothetical protein